MARQNNPQVKEYLVKFVIDRLRQCQLFVDEYGENFAQERLAINLGDVFTNEVSNSKAGYYKPSDHSITICSSGQNGDLLRTEDLSEFEKHIILHEAVHAIFNKTEEESIVAGIKCGTGMDLCFYRSGIGRGLNEGLTEWICEKAEFENDALASLDYLTLKKFIKQIELAIGEKNVIKLARGIINWNDRDNMANLLHMSTTDTKKYLILADQVFLSEKREKKYKHIIYTLERNEDLESPFIELFGEEDYKLYLKSEHLEDSRKSRLEYTYNMLLKNAEEKGYIRINFESMTFEHFFKKEFEDLIESEDISDEAFIKFYKLRELMEWPGFLKKLYEKGYDISFYENFEYLEDKYRECLLRRLGKDIESKKMNLEQCSKYIELLEMVGYIDAEIINVFENSGVKNPEATLYLIKRLQRDNSLDDINKYEIVEFRRSDNENETGNIVIYLKDGEPVFDMTEHSPKTISKEDKVDYNELFECTAEPGADISKTIQEFIKLKSELESEDPNVTFTILGSSFIVNSKGKTSYYYMGTDEIIPMEETGRHKVDFFIEKSEDMQQVEVFADKPEKNTQLAKPKRETFIQRMFNSIQRLLFPKATNGVSDIKKAKKGQPTGGSYLSSLRVEVSETKQGFQNNRNGRNQPSEDEINQSNSDGRYI